MERGIHRGRCREGTCARLWGTLTLCERSLASFRSSQVGWTTASFPEAHFTRRHPWGGHHAGLWGLRAVRTGGTLRDLTIAEQNEECGCSNGQGLCLQHGDLLSARPFSSSCTARS